MGISVMKSVIIECDSLCKIYILFIFVHFFLCLQQLKTNLVLVTSSFVMQVVMVGSEVSYHL